MLGGRHDARSGAFSFAGERGAASARWGVVGFAQYSVRGRGGRGWRAGRGGQGGEGGSGDPSHRQPKYIGGGETSPPDLGAHLWVHTEAPPPPPTTVVWRGGGQWGGNGGNPNRNL